MQFYEVQISKEKDTRIIQGIATRSSFPGMCVPGSLSPYKYFEKWDYKILSLTPLFIFFLLQKMFVPINIFDQHGEEGAGELLFSPPRLPVVCILRIAQWRWTAGKLFGARGSERTADQGSSVSCSRGKESSGGRGSGISRQEKKVRGWERHGAQGKAKARAQWEGERPTLTVRCTWEEVWASPWRPGQATAWF